MQTAVNIPDDLFEKAERAARETGSSRSELYAEALRRFLNDSEPAGGLDPEFESLQLEVLGDENWSEDGRLMSAGSGTR